MGIYLERDIDHVMAPYSYRPQFVRLPREYAAEIAWETISSRSSEHRAITVCNAHHIDMTVPVNEIPVALGLFAPGENSWRAVLETRNPDWCLVVDSANHYGGENFLLSLGRRGTIVPITCDCMTVMIKRLPDQRHLESRTLYAGTRLLEVEMYDDHPLAPDVLPPQHEKGQRLFYRVGIGQGEYRFQPWDMWPDDPRWFFPGVERLRTKKGALRKRFTTDDLEDGAQLFGLDPFNRDFLTGRFTKIVTGPPQPEVKHTVEDYRAARRRFLAGWDEEEGDS